jgi:aryl-alcohol dehydrogenase-like predicted oxidoreductase
VAELTVGSKWGYTYVADWRMDADVHEVKDHSLQTLRRQVGESRALLGSRLALYQIHSATLESGVLEDRGVLEELVKLRGDGLAIGLTTSGARQGETVRRALQVRVAGERPFDVVQATWNPLEPSAGPALAEAKEAGWGVIVKEAVANGRLVPGAPDLPRELDSVAERGHGRSGGHSGRPGEPVGRHGLVGRGDRRTGPQQRRGGRDRTRAR